MPDFSSAISGIESGGNYGLLGPTTKTGDRAYGKYQVMGQNVSPWTKEVLGVSLTPQQFLQSPQAQDAVFQGKFGQYVQKYGPEGAAKAWFAGEGGMNNPNARDQLGTSVADYARKFNAGMQSPITGPTNPASQQPTIPIQTAQGAPQESAQGRQSLFQKVLGAPQSPTQQMQTAPNSGAIGQSPFANMALTGGSGMPIGGLPTQSPAPNYNSPQQVNPQQMQLSQLQQLRMANAPRIQQFQQLVARLRQQMPTLGLS